MEICTPDTSVEYVFYNLGENGKIETNSKNKFKNIKNTYLDIYLVFKKKGNKGTPGVFIKHSGAKEVYKLYIEEIKVSFDEKYQSKIKFNQSIAGEEFNYK